MASDAERIREAAARYGPTVDAIAHRYVNPVTGKRLSGEALLLKLTEGESRALTGDGRNAVSSAGARGWAQFTAGSRAAAIKDFGIDPWSSPEKAVHAAALHLRGKINGSTGLEGYNPGDPSYPAYILGQKIGGTRGRSSSRGSVGVGPNGVPRAAPGFDAGPVVPVADLQAAQAPVLPSAGIQAPAFTAQPTMPAGFLGVPSSGAPSAPAVPDPVAAAGVALPDVPAPSKAEAHAVAGATVLASSRGYPLARRGKVIGVPYAGTHTLGNWQSDNAIDIAVPIGTRVLADESATVVKVKIVPNGSGRFAGSQVTLRGSSGGTFYTHLSRVDVRPGQKVKRGQVIGRSGSANGVAHLHIGVEHGDPRKRFG